MTGVVLCGGESLRMKSDKGLLHHQSITWAELAATKLMALQLPAVLSVNDQQLIRYSKLLQNYTLIKDDNWLQIGGPLKGILSVHAQYQKEDLLVLACDMRDMEAEALQCLMKASTENNADAYVFGVDGDAQPLCGIYKLSALKKIYAAYRNGNLEKHSMHYALKLLNVTYLNIPQKWINCFANFNAPEDLNAM